MESTCYGRGEYLLHRSLLSEGDTDFPRYPLALSGGVVGVFSVGDVAEASVNGSLVSLVKREKIPRFGSHWK